MAVPRSPGFFNLVPITIFPVLTNFLPEIIRLPELEELPPPPLIVVILEELPELELLLPPPPPVMLPPVLVPPPDIPEPATAPKNQNGNKDRVAIIT